MRGERSWGGSFASIFAYTLSAFADRASGRSRDLYLLEQTPRNQPPGNSFASPPAIRTEGKALEQSR